MHRRPKISHALHWSMLLFDWGYVQETHGLCAMQTQVWSNLYVCRYCHHGCQMVGISWKTWEHFDNFYYHLVHIVAICFILWQFGTFVDHLWYFPNFGILYQEKYGNPECHQCSMYCCRFQWVHRTTFNWTQEKNRLKSTDSRHHRNLKTRRRMYQIKKQMVLLVKQGKI
jgi:hypothetical protein